MRNSKKFQQSLNEASRETGVHADLVFGTGGRGTRDQVALRKAVIARLYNPQTAGQGGKKTSVKWGLSDIARCLEVSHTTVFTHVRSMGLHKGTTQ